MALNDGLAALEQVWADRMPITGALGIAAVAAGDDHLVLQMPLRPNRNHKGTVFAGSLSALATLTGWSAVWLLLHDTGRSAHIVIQDASIRYLHPVRSDATARVTVPGGEARDRLLTTLDRRGRARIPLEVTVRDESGEVVATFRGRYVVHR